MSIRIRKLRIYAMMMRLEELRQEKRKLIFEPPKAPEPVNIKLSILPKLEPMIYHPQSHYDELPQKVKHRKKRRFHN